MTVAPCVKACPEPSRRDGFQSSPPDQGETTERGGMRLSFARAASAFLTMSGVSGSGWASRLPKSGSIVISKERHPWQRPANHASEDTKSAASAQARIGLPCHFFGQLAAALLGLVFTGKRV